MFVKSQAIGVFLEFTVAFMASSLAAVDDCLQSQFWNGTHCVSCSLCPPGHGVKTNCSKKLDTECEACIAGYDYSDTTGFESCLGCDKFSHCPLTNAKEVNKCTVYSKRVCDGCLDGYFLNPGTGGCEECSLPCGFNKIETRPCTTDHDRTCSPKAIVPTILATNSTPKEVSKRVFKPSVKPRTPPNQIDGDSPSPQETKIVKNHWLWISISIGVVVLIAVTILMIFCYRRKKRNQKGRRNRAANARSDEETRDRQEVIPLMQGLDLPIKDLTIDGKMFIAQRLNGKNSFGYYYWQPTGEKLGFHSECRAWETAENPTEKLLKAYGEKAGSTVRNLIKALRDPEVGQTQFANEIEIKFSSSTTQDQNKGESSGEIESNV